MLDRSAQLATRYVLLRDNLDENGATIWVRIGGRVLG